MPYGIDFSVFVEDKAGDYGNPGSSPWWLSPDVDIPAHSGEAVQGPNDVQIRVHARDEPAVNDKIVAEVYVGNPSLVMSPTTGTKRIDPGTLLFRSGVAGSEPVATEAGATLTFPWTPSATAGDVDGPGHHCLVVRAFAMSVTPPTGPFDVPNEQHEAQHNVEILTTTTVPAPMGSGGAGTPGHPRHIDKDTGMWWERLDTMAVGGAGKRYVVWAFDPSPDEVLVESLRHGLRKAHVSGFSKHAPAQVAIESEGAHGEEIDPAQLLKDRRFASHSGVGSGLFAADRLLGALAIDLTPRRLAHVVLRFDHSNIDAHSAVVLHCAQWSASGAPEGGMTVVALAPTDR